MWHNIIYVLCKHCGSGVAYNWSMSSSLTTMFISNPKTASFVHVHNARQIHCTAILLKFLNKVTSVMRYLRVSDLNIIAQSIKVASEGEHRHKHNHAVSSLACYHHRHTMTALNSHWFWAALCTNQSFKALQSWQIVPWMLSHPTCSIDRQFQWNYSLS